MKDFTNLIESLLVDVAVLLEFRLRLLELLVELLVRHVLVLAECVSRQRAQLSDLLGALLNLGLEQIKKKYCYKMRPRLISVNKAFEIKGVTFAQDIFFFKNFYDQKCVTRWIKFPTT